MLRKLSDVGRAEIYTSEICSNVIATEKYVKRQDVCYERALARVILRDIVGPVNARLSLAVQPLSTVEAVECVPRDRDGGHVPHPTGDKVEKSTRTCGLELFLHAALVLSLVRLEPARVARTCYACIICRVMGDSPCNNSSSSSSSNVVIVKVRRASLHVGHSRRHLAAISGEITLSPSLHRPHSPSYASGTSR